MYYTDDNNVITSAYIDVGDIILTTQSTLGDDYLLCNGSGISPSEYPELSNVLGVNDSSTPFTSTNVNCTCGTVYKDMFVLGYNKNLYYGSDINNLKTKTLDYSVWSLESVGDYLYCGDSNGGMHVTSSPELDFSDYKLTSYGNYCISYSDTDITCHFTEDDGHMNYSHWNINSPISSTIYNIYAITRGGTESIIRYKNDIYINLYDNNRDYFIRKYNNMEYPETGADVSNEYETLSTTNRASSNYHQTHGFYMCNGNFMCCQPYGNNIFIDNGKGIEVVGDGRIIYNDPYYYSVSGKNLYRGTSLTDMSIVNTSLPTDSYIILFCSESNQFIAIGDTVKYLNIQTELPTISIDGGAHTINAFIRAK